MQLFFSHGIPDFVADTFKEIFSSNNEIFFVKDNKNFFAQLKIGCKGYLVLQYDKEVEKVVKKVKLSFPDMKILLFNVHMSDIVQQTHLITRLLSSGVDFCFTSNIAKDKLRELLLMSVVKESSLVNREIQKYHLFAGQSKAITTLKEAINEAVVFGRNVIIRGAAGTGKANVARIIYNCSYQKNLQFKSIDFTAYDSTYLENQFWMTFRNLFEEIESGIEGLRNPIYGVIYIEGLQNQVPQFIESLVNMIKTSQDKINNNEGVSLAPRVVISWEDNDDKFNLIKDNCYVINMPLLKDRKEDIPVLVQSIVDKYAEKYNKRIQNLSFDMISVFLSYDWPGNIQELQSVVETAVINTQDGIIKMNDAGITLDMLSQASRRDHCGSHLTLRQSLHKLQTLLIRSVLESADFDLGKSAVSLGLNKTDLLTKIDELGIKVG